VVWFGKARHGGQGVVRFGEAGQGGQGAAGYGNAGRGGLGWVRHEGARSGRAVKLKKWWAVVAHHVTKHNTRRTINV
jgi:hypothetical protein